MSLMLCALIEIYETMKLQIFVHLDHNKRKQIGVDKIKKQKKKIQNKNENWRR